MMQTVRMNRSLCWPWQISTGVASLEAVESAKNLLVCELDCELLWVLLCVLLCELVCCLTTSPPMFSNDGGHGHAVVKEANKDNVKRMCRRTSRCNMVGTG